MRYSFPNIMCFDGEVFLGAQAARFNDTWGQHVIQLESKAAGGQGFSAMPPAANAPDLLLGELWGRGMCGMSISMGLLG